MKPVAAQIVQQIFGIAKHEGRLPFVYALNGFTSQASQWGSQAGVALFKFDLMGQAEPVNGTAQLLVHGQGPR